MGLSSIHSGGALLIPGIQMMVLMLEGEFDAGWKMCQHFFFVLFQQTYSNKRRHLDLVS